MTARQARDRRRTQVRVRLTDRDQVLLAAVGRFGLAKSHQLRDLLFLHQHRDIFADRARRLFDAGYLDVRSGGLNEENVYSLGPKGRLWAKDRALPVTLPPRGGLGHWLGIVESWVQVARYAHETPGVELIAARPEWEIRPEALGYPVIPDLTVELLVRRGGGGRTTRLAVEVDLGTERASVLRRKVENYRNLLAFGEGLLGWVDFWVGFAVRGWSRARQESFARMLEETLPTWSHLWDLDDGPEAVLRGLVADVETPVGTPRYGNGSSAAGSADVVVDSSSEEEGL